MDSSELKIDESACKITISSIKSAVENINEATNIIALSHTHIDFGLRGHGASIMMAKYNIIVKEIKTAGVDMQKNIADINKISSTFEDEDRALAKTESISR